MPKTTKPNEQISQYPNDFTWEQFTKDCLLNRYALVVGSEVILNCEVNPESGGDSTQYLFDKTLHLIAADALEDEYPGNSQAIPESELLEEYRHLKRRYKSFTQLDRKYKNVKDFIWKTAKELIESNSKERLVQLIEPKLLDLLKTRRFRIVITTAIDPFLELAMEKVWGKDGFDIIQIENAKQSFKLISYDEFNVNRPTLCYMFGRINIHKSSLENSFVISENNAIEKIANWFNSAESNGFLKYLRNYNIFSIGPQFDDWMFRFFWYLLRGEIGKNSGCQQVAVEINNENRGLTNYLESENVKVFPDAREFMHDTVKQIKSLAPSLRLPRRDQGIFISYSHKDKYIALPLFEKLRSEGIPVWIDDEELDDGDEFKERITNAINTCKIFIPILSTSIKEQIKNGTMMEQLYYQNEWCLFNERYDKEKNEHEEIMKMNEHSHPTHSFKTIPFIVGKYDYSQDYHQSIQDCIKNASINDSFVLAKDRVEHLIEILNKQ